MNLNRAKQIFVDLAKELPEPGKGRPQKSGPITESLLIRGGMVLHGEIANKYFEALEEMSDIVTADETWNKDAVDELLANRVRAVEEVSTDQRQQVIRAQADELVVQLSKSPETWEIDLSVYGMHPDCAGLKFGKIAFLIEKVESSQTIPGFIDAAADNRTLFARTSVEAIDQKSAIDRAAEIVDRHLDVLNAICVQYFPSRTRLSRSTFQAKQLSIMRTRNTTQTEAAARFHGENLSILLSRPDYDKLVSQRGGSAVSALLLTQNSFATRVIAGYEIAGTACVEQRPQLSFLLLAIALESVVLGKDTKSEITYQLSARIAHLLTSDVPSRRTVVKTVNDLYDLRSKIVHTGKDEVAETELRILRHICLETLLALATLPAFVDMETAEDLDQWFNDRMLGATEPPTNKGDGSG